MKITTQHASSSYGVPVILDDRGQVMDYAPGIKAIRAEHGWSTDDVAARCGVSRRTVEGWEGGRVPSAPALMALAGALRE